MSLWWGHSGEVRGGGTGEREEEKGSHLREAADLALRSLGPEAGRRTCTAVGSGGRGMTVCRGEHKRSRYPTVMETPPAGALPLPCPRWHAKKEATRPEARIQPFQWGSGPEWG